MGLLRPNASGEVWSFGISATERKRHLKELVKKKKLIPVDVEGTLFHALPETLKAFEPNTKPEPVVRFLAPLDHLMWDRKAVAHLFEFDYLWEVYKPEKDRRWGYYVLPVMFEDKFVARVDSRLIKDTWHIYKWYWEDGVKQTPELMTALEHAISRFRAYLGAETLKLPRGGLDKGTRAALKAGFARD